MGFGLPFIEAGTAPTPFRYELQTLRTTKVQQPLGSFAPRMTWSINVPSTDENAVLAT
jgi:hypothetical protein